MTTPPYGRWLLNCTTPPIPTSGRGCGTWISRKVKNATVHAREGNHRQALVLAQNVPQIYKNVASIGAHLDLLVEEYKPTVLFITELPEDKVEMCAPKGYVHVKGCLKNSTRPVRASCLVKEGVNYEVKNISTEVPTCTVKIDSWYFTGCYREWGKEAQEGTYGTEQELQRFQNFTERWTKLRGKRVLLGDFNLDLQPKEGDVNQARLEPLRQLVEDTILTKCWVQMITEPTRRKRADEAESATLDHVYVNRVNHVEEVVNTNVIDTDHNLVGCCVRTDKEVHIPRTFLSRNIKAVDPTDFDTAFLDSCLDKFWSSTNINEALSILEQKILQVLNKLAPLRKITTRENYAPWHTSEIKEKIKRKVELRRLLTRMSTIAEKVEFSAYKKEVREAVVQAKLNWTKSYLNTEDPAKRWKRGKEMSGMEQKKKEADVAILIDGKIETDPKKTAPYMNHGFKDKVVKLQEKVKIDLSKVEEYARRYMEEREFKPEQLRPGTFKTVSTRDVRRVILSLQNTGAQGRDQISTLVLKKFAWTLAPPLRKIVNMSLEQCKYPEDWKEGIICPLPKAAQDLTLVKNWRPIVINCSASKILEKIVNKQLGEYLEEQKIHSTSQHAYRPGRSCSTALQDVDTLVNGMRNQGRISVLLLTDMSAAFNVIKKEVLLKKMEVYGFDKWSRKLIEDYLTGRVTRTKIGNFISDKVHLSSGVGEGSVLGPCIFSMGLCDVSTVATDTVKACQDLGIDVLASTVEFADDITGIIGAYTEEDCQLAINIMMKNFKNYFSVNGLVLNETKCSILVCRPGKKVTELKLGEQSEESFVKLLGLYIDSGYNFATHIQKMKSSVLFKISCIKKISCYLSDKNLRTMVESMVLSKISYCGEIYIGKTMEVQKQVQRLINPAARVLLRYTGRDQDYSTAAMMKDAKWWNATCLWVKLLVHNLRRCLQGHGALRTFMAIQSGHKDHWVRSCSVKIAWGKKLNRHARNSFVVMAARWMNELQLYGRSYVDENGKKSEKEVFKEAVDMEIQKKINSGQLSNGHVEQFQFKNDT